MKRLLLALVALSSANAAPALFPELLTGGYVATITVGMAPYKPFLMQVRIPGPGGRGSSSTPIAFVHAQQGNSDSATASVATTAMATTAANLLVVFIRHTMASGSCAAAPISSVTNTGGDTFTLIGSIVTSSDACLYGYYAKAIAGNAADVITATNATTSVSYFAVIVHEYSGLSLTAPLDTSASGTSNSANTITTGTFTTAAAAEVIVSGAQISNLSTTFTPDTGYTTPTNGTNATGHTSTQYKIVSSIQTGVTTTMGFNATAACQILSATFKQ